MSSKGSSHTIHVAPGLAGHDHHQSFLRKYVFSTDHKVIGIQYGITSLCFLLFGFILMMIMRWQLAYPGQPIPFIGKFLGEERAPDGIMLPEFYNQLGAMHGTIMVLELRIWHFPS
jgi:cytochrome c oxidase subunit 1